MTRDEIKRICEAARKKLERPGSLEKMKPDRLREVVRGFEDVEGSVLLGSDKVSKND